MNTVKIVVLCCVAIVIEYLLGAFVQADINFTNWTIDARMLVALLIGSTVVTAAVCTVELNGENNV